MNAVLMMSGNMMKIETKRGSLKSEKLGDLNMTLNGEVMKQTHQYNGHDCSSQLGNGPSSMLRSLVVNSVPGSITASLSPEHRPRDQGST